MPAKHPPGFRRASRIKLVHPRPDVRVVLHLPLQFSFFCNTGHGAAEFGFKNSDITDILSAWSLAYGTGQLVNGLLTDRIGGKTAMLIGAAGKPS